MVEVVDTKSLIIGMFLPSSYVKWRNINFSLFFVCQRISNMNPTNKKKKDLKYEIFFFSFFIDSYRKKPNILTTTIISETWPKKTTTNFHSKEKKKPKRIILCYHKKKYIKISCLLSLPEKGEKKNLIPDIFRFALLWVCFAFYLHNNNIR